MLAIVSTFSNRCYLLGDDSSINSSNIEMLDKHVIEVENIGINSISLKSGETVTTISIYPKNRPFSTDAYHIIKKWPDSMSLLDAYEAIQYGI